MIHRRLKYPETLRQSVTEKMGGVTFEDPYQWLEESSAEVLDWQRQQNSAAEDYLGRWSGREALQKYIEPFIGDMVTFALQHCGNRWLHLTASSVGMKISVSDSPRTTGRLLVDTSTMYRGSIVSLDYWAPSPDGRYVAFALSLNGDEQSIIHIVETEFGKVLPERLPFASFGHVAWLPDSSGMYYSAGIADDKTNAQKFIYFHRPGTPAPAEPEPVHLRVQAALPQVSADARFVAAVPSEIEPRPDYVKDHKAGGPWRPFLRDVPGVFIGGFLGESYIAITSDGAPRGRVVSIPVASGADRSKWVELIPESEAVMRSLSIIDRWLVLAEMVSARSRIRIFSTDGTFLEEVKLPGIGAANTNSVWWGQAAMEPMITAGNRDFTFTFASYEVSPSVYRYDLEHRKLELITPPKREHPDVSTRQVHFAGTDAALVSCWVVNRRDLDPKRPHPTLIYGYGGWNVAFVPTYMGALAAFVEAGGILAFPNLRGGGEYGWDWWQQGRLEHKQQTYDDLYSTAEYLIGEGLTSSSMLAIAGASNGGLLTAVAVTQRPELFKAVVSLVPVIDAMRFTRDSFGEQMIEEYGDPRKAGDAPYIHAYSPYHNVREGTAYPATLVVCSENDIRCPPWNGRKMVARMQHANAADTPILLRVWSDSGHPAALLGDAAQTSDWLGFIMEQLDLAPPGPE